MDLNGKVALVTGSAQGLGRAFAEILLKNGAKVSLLDINVPKGEEMKAVFDQTYGPEQTTFIPCDVTSEVQLKDAFHKTKEKFGKLDIVCNNAGIANEQDWEKTITVNLNGVIRGTYLAMEIMKQQKEGGVIVNTASLAGLEPLTLMPVYSATKHGIIGFTRAMAKASTICKSGVRLNALCPAFVQTNLMDNVIDNDQLAGVVKSMTLDIMKRIGPLNVSEVAEAFLQLVTDESKNGAVMKIEKQGGANYVQFQLNTELKIAP
ncbi:15-hydroxyprostaglandin dehydrogenase [NAD(+)]-like isoform X1 [Polypterus senegalus]|uniref:15-hydroxyprostaglandin dehydrogenase [NAD(+)]-like isoform X1 n=1 Tax=Polypterus senegalus TaxID=55291 RepID=UPI001963F281|nr:15-hydroxyprostaglandin dehydrogenase [NAD(+)]-like isoform X1 [Polypterus senegalus]